MSLSDIRSNRDVWGVILQYCGRDSLQVLHQTCKELRWLINKDRQLNIKRVCTNARYKRIMKYVMRYNSIIIANDYGIQQTKTAVLCLLQSPHSMFLIIPSDHFMSIIIDLETMGALNAVMVPYTFKGKNKDFVTTRVREICKCHDKAFRKCVMAGQPLLCKKMLMNSSQAKKYLDVLRLMKPDRVLINTSQTGGLSILLRIIENKDPNTHIVVIASKQSSVVANINMYNNYRKMTLERSDEADEYRGKMNALVNGMYTWKPHILIFRDSYNPDPSKYDIFTYCDLRNVGVYIS